MISAVRCLLHQTKTLKKIPSSKYTQANPNPLPPRSILTTSQKSTSSVQTSNPETHSRSTHHPWKKNSRLLSVSKISSSVLRAPPPHIVSVYSRREKSVARLAPRGRAFTSARLLRGCAITPAQQHGSWSALGGRSLIYLTLGPACLFSSSFVSLMSV